MSTVEAENTSITGYPGTLQLYSSTATIKNASIMVPYSEELDNYYEEQDAAVFKTEYEYGSALTLENSSIESNTGLIIFEIGLGESIGEGLVLNNTEIKGSAFRLIETVSQVSIGIYNSEINWNSTVESYNNHEIVRMVCNSNSPGLEFNLVNTSITVVSSRKFDIEYVKRVYWKNVTIEFHGPPTYSDDVLKLYYVQSARIDNVNFIGVPGIYAGSSLLYITGGGVYNLTASSSTAGGLLYIYTGGDAFIDSTVFKNDTGSNMVYVIGSSGRLGIANININESVGSTYNWYFIRVSNGVVYVGNFVANHSIGTPVYVYNGELYMHYSLLTNNTGFGLKADGGIVNVTYNYWGSAGGPEFSSTADADDPEEIYNKTTVYYEPFLTELPRENDTTPPTIEITSPSDNAILNGLVWFNVSYSDNYGVMAVVILVDELPAAILYDGEKSVRIETPIFKDGNHTVYAIAYDYAGHASVDSVNVKIENNKPSAEIVEPANNSIVSGDVTVRYYVYDDNLDNAKLYGNDTILSYTTNVGYASYGLRTTNYNDGVLWLKVIAVDRDGQTSEYKIAVTIDNTPPSLTIEAPENNSYVKGIQEVKFTTYDEHLGEYRIYLNDTLAANDTSEESVTFDLDTTEYDDGLYKLTVWSIDKAGNENSSTIFVTIDNTPPNVAILSPSSGESVSGIVDITVDASDNIGLKWVVIYINGSLVFSKTVDPNNPSDPTYTYSWNTTNYQNGSYNITVVVSDPAGNTDTDQEIVYVTNASPIPEPNFLAIVGVAGALAIALLETRRRSH